MERRIDLHMHSVISDGVLTPKELIDEAVKNNVDTISICDHDSIEAYTDELTITEAFPFFLRGRGERIGSPFLGIHCTLPSPQIKTPPGQLKRGPGTATR